MIIMIDRFIKGKYYVFLGEPPDDWLSNMKKMADRKPHLCTRGSVDGGCGVTGHISGKFLGCGNWCWDQLDKFYETDKSGKVNWKKLIEEGK